MPPHNCTTLRIDSPVCIRSNGLLMSSSAMVWGMRSSMLILPSMYPSRIFDTSVRSFYQSYLSRPCARLLTSLQTAPRTRFQSSRSFGIHRRSPIVTRLAGSFSQSSLLRYFVQTRPYTVSAGRFLPLAVADHPRLLC